MMSCCRGNTASCFTARAEALKITLVSVDGKIL